MKPNWKFFIPAVVFGGYLLLSRGVPPGAVLLGCAVAALADAWLIRRGRSHRLPPGP